MNKKLNRSKICALSLLGVLCWSYLSGQHPSNFIHLPSKLDNHTIKVTHTVQDSLGFVWLAHAEGISKYDGYNFEFTSKESIFKEETTSDEVKKYLVMPKG